MHSNFQPLMKLILFALLAEYSLALRDAPNTFLRVPSNINLEKVLDGRNLTAVVVDAKAVSNGTIQVVFEANISSTSGLILTKHETALPSPVPVPKKDKTSIQIVYAAEEPQSVHLLKEALVPLFTRPDILNVTSLELIPFGLANEIRVDSLSAGFLYWHPELKKGNITHVYRCPNGERECEASLIHGCGVSAAHNDPSVFAPFITCMASVAPDTAPEDASFSCSNSTSFMESLRACALGPIGVELQHQLASKASSTKRLPTVYINEQAHPLNVTDTIKSDLAKLVCDGLFADGNMDRDACVGRQEKPIVAPFQSLLTSPSSKVAKA